MNGPRGGLSMNVRCLLCEAQFNIGPALPGHRLLLAEVLKDGRALEGP